MDKLSVNLVVNDGEFPLVRSKSDTNFMRCLNNAKSK